MAEVDTKIPLSVTPNVSRSPLTELSQAVREKQTFEQQTAQRAQNLEVGEQRIEENPEY